MRRFLLFSHKSARYAHVTYSVRRSRRASTSYMSFFSSLTPVINVSLPTSRTHTDDVSVFCVSFASSERSPLSSVKKRSAVTNPWYSLRRTLIGPGALMVTLKFGLPSACSKKRSLRPVPTSTQTKNYLSESQCRQPR